jgi:hypothetical protein
MAEDRDSTDEPTGGSRPVTEATSRREGQDELIIAGLAAGRSYDEVGALVRVSGRTIARRMANPDFARRVAQRRGEQVHAMSGQLTLLAQKAVTALAGCLEDEDGKTRLAAAKVVMDYTLRFRHQHDLELSVAEIRSHLGLAD